MKGRIRKISAGKSGAKNFYLVDACVLANFALPGTPGSNRASDELMRINRTKAWWKRMLDEADRSVGRVYIPEICIAEAFKALAHKQYKQSWWVSTSGFNSAKNKLAKLVSMSHAQLQKQRRTIKIHDIAVSRDILVSVGRFHEAFLKANINVQIADLILVSTAKFMIDFYDIPKDRLHILTGDKRLLTAINKCVPELPSGYDPMSEQHEVDKIFV